LVTTDRHALEPTEDARAGMLEQADSPGTRRVQSDLLRIAIDVEDHAVVVTLEGEVDSSVRGALMTELLHAVRVAAERRIAIVEVVLDRLGFCDSTGIQAFLQAHEDAIDHGLALVLVAPRDAVRRTLDIACVGDIIEISDQR
jgi:anti-sigma B factor antagonist